MFTRMSSKNKWNSFVPRSEYKKLESILRLRNIKNASIFNKTYSTQPNWF